MHRCHLKPLGTNSAGGFMHQSWKHRVTEELENSKSVDSNPEKNVSCKSPETWRKFIPRLNGSGPVDNEYLMYYLKTMEELSTLHWINAEGDMDLPANRRQGYVHVLGSYIDNCVMPLRRMYSWGVPTEEALKAIIDVSPAGVVEVGAGTGYWAMLLHTRGVDIVAYDRTPVEGKLWDRSSTAFCAQARTHASPHAAKQGRRRARLPRRWKRRQHAARARPQRPGTQAPAVTSCQNTATQPHPPRSHFPPHPFAPLCKYWPPPCISL